MKILEFPYTIDSLYELFSSIGWAPLSDLINLTGKLLVNNAHALFIFPMFHLRSCLEPPFLQLSSFLRLLWDVMDSLVLVVLGENQSAILVRRCIGEDSSDVFSFGDRV